MKLNFNNIKNEVLSPGDIFWKKNNGADLLISKKGDILNFDLIQKIMSADYDLSLEDSIDLEFHDSMYSLYVKYSEELLMKDKMKWRYEIIENLQNGFIAKSKSQFELNHLGWKFFSKFTKSETLTFIKKDKDLFSRNTSIASSFTFCAFLLGYYDSSFLSQLFTNTFNDLMALGQDVEVLILKEKIEHLRKQDSFNSLDCKFIKEITPRLIINSTMIFERYDGSGLREINSREMSDLEIVFVALDRYFGFDVENEANVLIEITNSKIDCEVKILKMLQKVLYFEPKMSIRITG